MSGKRVLQTGFPFVVACLAILRKFGVLKGRTTSYDDGVIRMELCRDRLEIIRVANRNPVVMLMMPPEKRMDCIRWHGEASLLLEHVAGLYMEHILGEKPVKEEETMSETSAGAGGEANVQVNDIWMDLDPRCNGRLLKVLAIEGDSALVQHPTGMGARRRVRLDRLKPRATRGYKLIERNGQPLGIANDNPAAA